MIQEVPMLKFIGGYIICGNIVLVEVVNSFQKTVTTGPHFQEEGKDK